MIAKKCAAKFLKLFLQNYFDLLPQIFLILMKKYFENGIYIFHNYPIAYSRKW
jgi:hypothetical protein